MRASRVAIGLLALSGLLAGCSADEALGAKPVTPPTEITETGGESARLPPGFTSDSVVQFDSQPLVAGDLAVGMHLPTANRPGLNIFGVAADETRLHLLTNPSCVGFVSTRDTTGALLVVLDSNAASDGGRLATTTVATAFRVDDGSVAWGPVSVPGPVVSGSGLIFADTPKSIVASDGGPRVMLSADDGSVVTGQSDPDVSFLYEHHGLGLISVGGSLQAIDTASNSIRWLEEELPRPEEAAPGSSATFTPMIGTDLGGILSLTWETRDGQGIVAAYDFATGKYLGSLPPGSLDATTTAPNRAASAFASTREGVTTITALSPDKGLLWQTEMVGDIALGAATDAAVYMRADGQGVALSWDNGKEIDRGDFAIPTVVVSNGTALIPTGAPYEFAVAHP